MSYVFGYVHEGWGKELMIYDQFGVVYEDIQRGSGNLYALLRLLFPSITLRSPTLVSIKSWN